MTDRMTLKRRMSHIRPAPRQVLQHHAALAGRLAARSAAACPANRPVSHRITKGPMMSFAAPPRRTAVASGCRSFVCKRPRGWQGHQRDLIAVARRSPLPRQGVHRLRGRARIETSWHAGLYGSAHRGRDQTDSGPRRAEFRLHPGEPATADRYGNGDREAYRMVGRRPRSSSSRKRKGEGWS
jgi:hypothetical protein